MGRPPHLLGARRRRELWREKVRQRIRRRGLPASAGQHVCLRMLEERGLLRQQILSLRMRNSLALMATTPWDGLRRPNNTSYYTESPRRLRFDDRFIGNPYERMVTLRQTCSVDEYVNSFTQLATQAQPLTKAQALGYYLGGLKQIIRNKLRVVEPPDLESAIRLSRSIEWKLKNGSMAEFYLRKTLRHCEVTWLGELKALSPQTQLEG
ncbi:uncharacterized protein LOC127256770 [Andrographis paniculata]|uniref:uncharacterized protein LOC127256770 n=1 Tax=Andrographis paniculata TaxID=175694 RepID=UPI0021E7E79C|nr:uncharacterized protein LOC127256770 [Andrographis paniculata]XP_051138911.1 uncharacterized protein LOC127256770 [Andrographis paniculata]